jgi:hypothetical protein
MNCHNASGLSHDIEAVIVNPDRNRDFLIEEVQFISRTLTRAEEVKLVRGPKTLNELGDRGRKHQNRRGCSKRKDLPEWDQPTERNLDEGNDPVPGIESPCSCEGILERMNRPARPGEDHGFRKPTFAWGNRHH